jgi:hypothetical protein
VALRYAADTLAQKKSCSGLPADKFVQRCACSPALRFRGNFSSKLPEQTLVNELTPTGDQWQASPGPSLLAGA